MKVVFVAALGIGAAVVLVGVLRDGYRGGRSPLGAGVALLLALASLGLLLPDVSVGSLTCPTPLEVFDAEDPASLTVDSVTKANLQTCIDAQWTRVWISGGLMVGALLVFLTTRRMSQAAHQKKSPAAHG